LGRIGGSSTNLSNNYAFEENVFFKDTPAGTPTLIFPAHDPAHNKKD